MSEWNQLDDDEDVRIDLAADNDDQEATVGSKLNPTRRPEPVHELNVNAVWLSPNRSVI